MAVVVPRLRNLSGVLGWPMLENSVVFEIFRKIYVGIYFWYAPVAFRRAWKRVCRIRHTGFYNGPRTCPVLLSLLYYLFQSPITSFLFSNLFSLTFPWPSFWYQLRLGRQIVVSFFLFFKISFYFLVATLVSFKPFYHFPYFFKKFGKIS